MSVKSYIVVFLLLFGLSMQNAFATSYNGPDDPGNFKVYSHSIYTELHDKDIKFEVFELALKGYLKLYAEKKIDNNRYLSIIDMSLSANKDRFFLIDLKEKKVIRKSKVAHGRNTGGEFAKYFSNKNGSHQTSLGFYRTAETYYGKHGKSIRLDGLEDSNSNARERAIVIHSADYVSDHFIQKHGRLGRSYGCPALPKEGYEEIVEIIKEGSVLFIYYPHPNYLSSSPLINHKLQNAINNIDLSSVFGQ